MNTDNDPPFKRLTKADVEALEEGVAKYRRLAAAPDSELLEAELGAVGCRLCRMYHSVGTSDPCAGCPVAYHAGAGGCHGTPYYVSVDGHLFSMSWALTIATGRRVEGFQRPQLRRALEAEAVFLQSLLDNAPKRKHE